MLLKRAHRWRKRALVLIAALPLPLAVRQAVHNVNQKKFRLALTGTTLTVAVGASMGIFAVFASLGDAIDEIFGAFGSQMSVEPTEVPPTQITRPAGRWPASRSDLMASRRTSICMAPCASTGMWTRLSCPMPDTHMALSMEL